ncbi:hypothetical protein, partial [Bradyrhizobium canariense]|uniref:hypothetical protein n=1 Tax=Bradyrhizobium canariense TaxID=255045 RepID=UPI002011813A
MDRKGLGSADRLRTMDRHIGLTPAVDMAEKGGGRNGRRRPLGALLGAGADMAERIALITGITGQDGAYLAEYLLSL